MEWPKLKNIIILILLLLNGFLLVLVGMRYTESVQYERAALEQTLKVLEGQGIQADGAALAPAGELAPLTAERDLERELQLAQALLGSPKVLLLDEPTAGLDPRERVRIRNFIKELAQDRIVLLATHIVTDIESIADQVLLLKKGKLLRVDTPQNLIGALPADWKPVMGVLSLEDVYLYFLGEQHG